MKRLLFLTVLAIILYIGCSEKLTAPVEPAFHVDTIIDTLIDTIVETEFDTTFDTTFDTAYIELPPDTVIEYDTTYDTTIIEVPVVDTEFVHVYDTTYLPGDTVYIEIVDSLFDTIYVEVIIHDTVHVTDTLTLTDTIYIEIIIHDTVTIIDTLTLTDTVYVPVVDTIYDTTIVVDTLIIYDPIYSKLCLPWELTTMDYADTIYLENEAGWYLVYFNRKVPTPDPMIPPDMEPAIKFPYTLDQTKQEFFFQPWGKRNEIYGFNVWLPENAQVVIKLEIPYITGKLTGCENCPVLLEGKWWWLVKAEQLE